MVFFAFHELFERSLLLLERLFVWPIGVHTGSIQNKINFTVIPL